MQTFQALGDVFTRMYSSRSQAKRKCFHSKSEFQMFSLISSFHIGVPLRLHKVTWTFRQITWCEMVCHTDLRLGEVVYVLVFYIISFSWLLSLNGFKYIFHGVTVKTIYRFCNRNKRRKGTTFDLSKVSFNWISKIQNFPKFITSS